MPALRSDAAQVRQKILWFIRDYQDLHGYPPLAKEIQAHIERSDSNTRAQIQALITTGHLTRGAGPRSYVVKKVDL